MIYVQELLLETQVEYERTTHRKHDVDYCSLRGVALTGFTEAGREPNPYRFGFVNYKIQAGVIALAGIAQLARAQL